MAVNPLEKSLAVSRAASAYLRGAFGFIGTSEHPRGRLLGAYRNVRRGMRSALKEGGSQAAVEVLNGFRYEVERIIMMVLDRAKEVGIETAIKELEIYGEMAYPVNPDTRSEQKAVMAYVDQQITVVEAMIASGADEALIIGDETRLGVLQPAPVAKEAANWIAAALWGGFADVVIGAPGAAKYQKQAVAVLSEKTTDCCLNVHGQIRDLDQPFDLTGTPRYADKQDWPGFHWWCRTSGVLYKDEFDFGLTEQMRDGARQVLAERETGENVVRRPADAFT